MRAKKVDANQGEIVEALRAMGASVESLAPLGNGCPDLLVGWRGHNILMEVKVPGFKLNCRQKPWHAGWKGRAHVVYSLAEAIEIMKAYRGT